MAQGKYRSAAVGAAAAAALLLFQNGLLAQGRGAPAGRGGPPPAAKTVAPIDLTGYWRAEVTEDWRWRMVTPAKGDWESMPMTPEAQEIAQNWDPQKDTAGGLQCKSYGAPGLMRAPTRMHITWQDDNTLKVDFDYGQQTRIIHFGNWKAPGGTPQSWQGDSVANWEAPGGGANLRPGAGGTMFVKTNNLKAGYLRKNGVPYSASTTMNEWWDIVKEGNGDTRILMLVEVNDPLYLRVPWIVPLHFIKEADGSKFDPTPCSSTW
jgi:hypothetical protein